MLIFSYNCLIKDIKEAKVDSAAEKMCAINPDISVIQYQETLCAENILHIIKEYDFVIDGSDNFATKFLVNDACILEKISFSHGGILRFEGQTMTVLPGKSACYRCAFKKPPSADAVPTCSQAGVLGAIAGILGTIQATEAVKYVLGIGDLLAGTLLTFDALSMDFHKIKLKKQADCLVCGENPTITEPVDEEHVACGETG